MQHTIQHRSNTNNQPAINAQRHYDYDTGASQSRLAFRQHSAPPCSSPRPPSTSCPPLCPSLPAVAIRRRIRRTLPSPVGRPRDDSGLAAPEYVGFPGARAVLCVRPRSPRPRAAPPRVCLLSDSRRPRHFRLSPGVAQGVAQGVPHSRGGAWVCWPTVSLFILPFHITCLYFLTTVNDSVETFQFTSFVCIFQQSY